MRTFYSEKYISNDADWFREAVASRIRVDGKKRTGYLTEKPYKLLERIIKMGSNKGDIVLDFFAGSGTTGYVANYLKRQFILVEQLNDTIDKIKLRFEYINPIYMELAEANQTFVEKIETATTMEQLQVIWQRMQQTGFLSYRINPQQIDQAVNDWAELSLADKKRFLIECLDMNLLYVPYADMDESTHSLTDEDKRLTRLFYANC